MPDLSCAPCQRARDRLVFGEGFFRSASPRSRLSSLFPTPDFVVYALGTPVPELISGLLAFFAYFLTSGVHGGCQALLMLCDRH